MDLDPKPPAWPKGKFKPKPPRKTQTAVSTLTESSNDDDDSDDNETLKSLLQRKLNDHLARHQPKKVGKKSPVQVSFHGVASDAIMTFCKKKEQTEDGNKDIKTEERLLDDRKRSKSVENQRSQAVTSILSEGTDEVMVDLMEQTTMDVDKKKRNYKEPWDYEHSYYPTTLPWRKPYSGDPEVLDGDEFEVEAKYDEKSINPASELGFLEQDGTPKLLLFQVPPLPLGRSGVKQRASNPSSSRSTTSKGKEIAGISQLSSNPCTQSRDLKDLPGGYMGKMMVYRSGAVKLKIGDMLYDVSPGITVTSPQDVMAVDTKSQNCIKLGEIEKRVVVTPDVESILGDI